MVKYTELWTGEIYNATTVKETRYRYSTVIYLAGDAVPLLTPLEYWYHGIAYKIARAPCDQQHTVLYTAVASFIPSYDDLPMMTKDRCHLVSPHAVIFSWMDNRPLKMLKGCSNFPSCWNKGYWSFRLVHEDSRCIYKSTMAMQRMKVLYSIDKQCVAYGVTGWCAEQAYWFVSSALGYLSRWTNIAGKQKNKYTVILTSQRGRRPHISWQTREDSMIGTTYPDLGGLLHVVYCCEYPPASSSPRQQHKYMYVLNRDSSSTVIFQQYYPNALPFLLLAVVRRAPSNTNDEG